MIDLFLRTAIRFHWERSATIELEQGVVFHFVRHYNERARYAFPEADAEHATTISFFSPLSINLCLFSSASSRFFPFGK